ncbi:MAG: glucose-6-phosphate isomerase [Rhodospirillales bacterium]|nr:glucose-6-phosphate isomerase [Rhodospirillales bacterium]
MSKLTDLPQWKALNGHFKTIENQDMRDWFMADANRFKTLSLQACGILLDYSKNRITSETLELLFTLARAVNLEGWRERMFKGEKINNTEGRAVLHVALRNRSNTPVFVDGADVMPAVNDVLARMGTFADAVRNGAWTGATGKRITDVVNIGIGGSDLGPNMVTEALSAYASKEMRYHFVSNVDGAHIAHVLSQTSWDTTLFIICSKTFTTQETMLNAQTARAWFIDQGGRDKDVARHFVAATTNVAAAEKFGIPKENLFEFWDWVGGRFSLWSAVGVSIAVAIGKDGFSRLLSGAHAMDRHFQDAPLEQNMPVILAMLRIWYTNFFGAQSWAVIPFSQNLRWFPDYTQQGTMESNGKSTDRDGQAVDYATSPVTWGKAGTDCQHSFFQLLHQGTKFIPADFLAAAQPDVLVEGHHDILLANFIAQTEALMVGKTEAQVRQELQAQGMKPETLEALLPHKVFPGNRPTNSLVYTRLDPETLGALIALYEHMTFVQGVMWNVNSFDQWGVELGKQLAQRILPELTGTKPADSHDSSTNNLINFMRKMRH